MGLFTDLTIQFITIKILNCTLAPMCPKKPGFFRKIQLSWWAWILRAKGVEIIDPGLTLSPLSKKDFRYLLWQLKDEDLNEQLNEYCLEYWGDDRARERTRIIGITGLDQIGSILNTRSVRLGQLGRPMRTVDHEIIRVISQTAESYGTYVNFYRNKLQGGLADRNKTELECGVIFWNKYNNFIQGDIFKFIRELPINCLKIRRYRNIIMSELENFRSANTSIRYALSISPLDKNKICLLHPEEYLKKYPQTAYDLCVYIGKRKRMVEKKKKSEKPKKDLWKKISRFIYGNATDYSALNIFLDKHKDLTLGEARELYNRLWICRARTESRTIILKMLEEKIKSLSPTETPKKEPVTGGEKDLVMKINKRDIEFYYGRDGVGALNVPQTQCFYVYLFDDSGKIIEGISKKEKLISIGKDGVEVNLKMVRELGGRWVVLRLFKRRRAALINTNRANHVVLVSTKLRPRDLVKSQNLPY